jgi:hypothetical protein
MIRFPFVAVLTLLASYGAFGWLLTINNASHLLYWIGSGALLFALNYFLALAWGVAAVLIVFLPKSNLLILSLGISIIWAALLYIARLEMLALASNRNLRFVLMFSIAAIAMGGGWLVSLLLPGFDVSNLWQKKSR